MPNIPPRSMLLVCLLLWPVLGGSTPPSKTANTPAAVLKSRVFIVFDLAERRIVRKAYKVFDPAPERRLEFEWIADRPSARDAELITGRGRLVWRRAGASSYDRGAVVSVYHGDMANGRPHGRGTLKTREGLHYEGEWRNGLYQGQGRLEEADGSAYEGGFKAGRFEGDGVLVDTTGDAFTGRFSQGVKHGRVKVRLGSGAAHSSTWAQGIENVGSRHVLMAQGAPFQELQFVPDRLQIGLRLDQMQFINDDDGRQREYTLQYALKTLPDRFSIFPDNKELMSAWKEGGSINYGCCFSYRPIPVTFRVRNTGAVQVEIRSVYLIVAESVADLQPLFVAFLHYSNDKTVECSEFTVCTRFDLLNRGWSQPLQGKIEAAFQPVTAGARAHRFTIALLPEQNVFDVEREFFALGVNMKQLRAWQPKGEHGSDGLPCPGMDDAACVSHLRAMGVFGQLADHVVMDEEDGLHVEMKAKLSFAWKDARGAVKAYSAPFAIQFPLGWRQYEVRGEGGTRPDKDPSTAFLVDLKPGKANYRIALPTKGVLGPSKELQIRLLLRTAQSSQHRFRLGVEFADGMVVTSKEVALQTFVDSDWEERKTQMLREDGGE